MHEKLVKIVNSKTFLQSLAAIILIAIFLSFVYQISLLRSQGNIAGFPKGYLLQTSTANLNMIQPWMTLHYIDKVYHIPPTYLQETLHIPADTYRHISISGYAKMSGLSTQEAIVKVQTAVHDYLQPSAIPQK